MGQKSIEGQRYKQAQNTMMQTRCIQINKKEVKLTLCRWCDTLLGKPERLHQKTSRAIHEFSKVTAYKINVQKSVAFLYTNNEAPRDIRASIPFTIASKAIKYLGINLTEEVKGIYSENYRKLMKEMEEDTKNWKNIPRSWI